jgi:hypothetical protein
VFELGAANFYSALAVKATKLELEALFDAREATIFVRHCIHYIPLGAGSDRLYGDAPDESCYSAACVARLWSASGH